MISPLASTSIFEARDALGRPGMISIAPEVITGNPATAENEILLTCRVQLIGVPIRLGSSESEYWVLAMHTGR